MHFLPRHTIIPGPGLAALLLSLTDGTESGSKQRRE